MTGSTTSSGITYDCVVLLSIIDLSDPSRRGNLKVRVGCGRISVNPSTGAYGATRVINTSMFLSLVEDPQRTGSWVCVGISHRRAYTKLLTHQRKTFSIVSPELSFEVAKLFDHNYRNYIKYMIVLYTHAFFNFKINYVSYWRLFTRHISYKV